MQESVMTSKSNIQYDQKMTDAFKQKFTNDKKPTNWQQCIFLLHDGFTIKVC